MERGRSEENNHKTSLPSSTKRIRYREISTGEKSCEINIPLDLTVEILKKIPTKSLLRFQCVSKQWLSIISTRRDFIDSIITRSLTQPRPRDTQFLFHHQVFFPNPNFFVFSSTYPAQSMDKESITTTATSYHHVRGLICCWSPCPTTIHIYNPTTRQYFSLSETNHYNIIDTCFFGYDPLENQYKVMVLPKYHMEISPCQVFTLGDPLTKPWRNIQGIGLHYPLLPAVCINGVIYYRASHTRQGSTYFLVSFDVRSEKLNHYVKAPKILMDHHCTLINYQGKLGFMCREKGVEIWVMEDADKKQEWSQVIHYEMNCLEKLRVRGVTHGGEIVFIGLKSTYYTTLYVYYYDPKRNSMRRVEIEGTEVDTEHRHKHDLRTLAVPDLVENTMRL